MFEHQQTAQVRYVTEDNHTNQEVAIASGQFQKADQAINAMLMG